MLMTYENVTQQENEEHRLDKAMQHNIRHAIVLPPTISTFTLRMQDFFNS